MGGGGGCHWVFLLGPKKLTLALVLHRPASPFQEPKVIKSSRTEQNLPPKQSIVTGLAACWTVTDDSDPGKFLQSAPTLAVSVTFNSKTLIREVFEYLTHETH